MGVQICPMKFFLIKIILIFFFCQKPLLGVNKCFRKFSARSDRKKKCPELPHFISLYFSYFLLRIFLSNFCPNSSLARANFWKKFLMIEKMYISEPKLIGMHSYSCFILLDLLSAYLMTFFMLFLEKIAKWGNFWTEIKSFKNIFLKSFGSHYYHYIKIFLKKYFFHPEKMMSQKIRGNFWTAI